MLDDFGTETREIILCLNANGISQMFIMTLLTEHEGGFPIPGWDWVYNRHQSILEADRRRSPPRKHFKGRMAAKGVFSLVFVFACVATSQVYGKATDPPTTNPPTTDPPTTDPPTTDPPTTPHCECINPFTETKPNKAYR